MPTDCEWVFIKALLLFFSFSLAACGTQSETNSTGDSDKGSGDYSGSCPTGSSSRCNTCICDECKVIRNGDCVRDDAATCDSNSRCIGETWNGCDFVSFSCQCNSGYHVENNQCVRDSSGGTTCTAYVGHACNGDGCGPPYRCEADGTIQAITEIGTCGSGNTGCSDCGWNALWCGTYTWNVGECHCVD